MEKNEKLKKYLDHYDAQIYTSYTDEDNCSFHVYREDTADGYEVFIAKYKSDSTVNIMDDVYFYQTDLLNTIVEKIHDGETIYVDDDIWNDNYMEDDIADMYDQDKDDWNDE